MSPHVPLPNFYPFSSSCDDISTLDKPTRATLDVDQVRELHISVQTLSDMTPTVHWAASGGTVVLSTLNLPGCVVSFTFTGTDDDEVDKRKSVWTTTELNSQRLVRLMDTIPVQPTECVTYSTKSNKEQITVSFLNPSRSRTLWIHHGPTFGAGPQLPEVNGQDHVSVLIPSFDLAQVLLATSLVAAEAEFSVADRKHLLVRASNDGAQIESSIAHVSTTSVPNGDLDHATSSTVSVAALYSMYHLVSKIVSHPFLELRVTGTGLHLLAGGYPVRVNAHFSALNPNNLIEHK